MESPQVDAKPLRRVAAQLRGLQKRLEEVQEASSHNEDSISSRECLAITLELQPIIKYMRQRITTAESAIKNDLESQTKTDSRNETPAIQVDPPTMTKEPVVTKPVLSQHVLSDDLHESAIMIEGAENEMPEETPISEHPSLSAETEDTLVDSIGDPFRDEDVATEPANDEGLEASFVATSAGDSESERDYDEDDDVRVTKAAQDLLTSNMDFEDIIACLREYYTDRSAIGEGTETPTLKASQRPALARKATPRFTIPPQRQQSSSKLTPLPKSTISSRGTTPSKPPRVPALSRNQSTYSNWTAGDPMEEIYADSDDSISQTFATIWRAVYAVVLHVWEVFQFMADRVSTFGRQSVQDPTVRNALAGFGVAIAVLMYMSDTQPELIQKTSSVIPQLQPPTPTPTWSWKYPLRRIPS